MKIVTALLALVLISTYCTAQDLPDSVSGVKSPWFVEKYKFSLGSFIPVSNTTVQVSIKGGASGTEIDFENDLGLDKGKFTILGNFQWRISRRSRLSLNYYNIPRSGSRVLSKDIVFNGQTYPVSASINSSFNTRVYQISYGYAFLAKPKYELGVLVGTHLVGGEVGMSLNNANGSISAQSDFGFTAPLPDLGIWGGYAFNDRFGVNFEFVYLSLTVGDVNGRILSYNLNFMYRLVDRLDVSLGYIGLNTQVGVTKSNAEANFKWGYNGPSLAFSYSFGKKSWEK